MTNIDQFESVFRAAEKTSLSLQEVPLERILVVSDLDSPATTQFSEQLRSFLAVLGQSPERSWHQVVGAQFENVDQLMGIVNQERPDLIATFRSLHHFVRDYPFSLGTFLDVLAQATAIPILVMPRPETGGDARFGGNTDSVMAITNHLTGDHRLVSYAARLTQPKGTLYLTHVEDAADFQRYVDTIAKIPGIDTESSAELLGAQLIKEPCDFIRTCRKTLSAHHDEIEIREIVTFGHHLLDYQRLVEQHQIDLLVFNTKDDDQLAMHGLAYPLAVEMRRTPLLLL